MPKERPYPNVVRARSATPRWEARVPRGTGRQEYLGTFDNPEEARIAVLTAQAEYLELKAAAYRSEAAMLQKALEVFANVTQ